MRPITPKRNFTPSNSTNNDSSPAPNNTLDTLQSQDRDSPIPFNYTVPPEETAALFKELKGILNEQGPSVLYQIFAKNQHDHGQQIDDEEEESDEEVELPPPWPYKPEYQMPMDIPPNFPKVDFHPNNIQDLQLLLSRHIYLLSLLRVHSPKLPPTYTKSIDNDLRMFDESLRNSINWKKARNAYIKTIIEQNSEKPVLRRSDLAEFSTYTCSVESFFDIPQIRNLSGWFSTIRYQEMCKLHFNTFNKDLSSELCKLNIPKSINKWSKSCLENFHIFPTSELIESILQHPKMIHWEKSISSNNPGWRGNFPTPLLVYLFHIMTYFEKRSGMES